MISPTALSDIAGECPNALACPRPDEERRIVVVAAIVAVGHITAQMVRSARLPGSDRNELRTITPVIVDL